MQMYIIISTFILIIVFFLFFYKETDSDTFSITSNFFYRIELSKNTFGSSVYEGEVLENDKIIAVFFRMEKGEFNYNFNDDKVLVNFINGDISQLCGTVIFNNNTYDFINVKKLFNPFSRKPKLKALLSIENEKYYFRYNYLNQIWDVVHNNKIVGELKDREIRLTTDYNSNINKILISILLAFRTIRFIESDS